MLRLKRELLDQLLLPELANIVLEYAYQKVARSALFCIYEQGCTNCGSKFCRDVGYLRKFDYIRVDVDTRDQISQFVFPDIKYRGRLSDRVTLKELTDGFYDHEIGPIGNKRVDYVAMTYSDNNTGRFPFTFDEDKRFIQADYRLVVMWLIIRFIEEIRLTHKCGYAENSKQYMLAYSVAEQCVVRQPVLYPNDVDEPYYQYMWHQVWDMVAATLEGVIQPKYVNPEPYRYERELWSEVRLRPDSFKEIGCWRTDIGVFPEE